jgi:putative hydrolase of the HAD superfamily
MITTVIFDLDDTLYDEIEYCKSGLKATARYLSGQPNTPGSEIIFTILWRQFSSGNRTKTFDAALTELGLQKSDEIINELVVVYRNHKPKIILPHESRFVLENLSRKYTLAMLTDGYLPGQKLKVKALDIEKYFKCIVYTEELGPDKWKPSPAGFEKILNNLGITPQKAVYVADNEEKDFIAPNKLGVVTIQISRPAGLYKAKSGQYHPQLAACYKISDINQLQATLEGIEVKIGN